MGALAADHHQPVAAHRAHPLAVLHRNAPLPFLHDHDDGDSQDRHQDEDEQLQHAALNVVLTTFVGMAAMMPPKMMIEMPLPMPSWVMIWPNHMAIIVPVVSETRITNGLERKAGEAELRQDGPGLAGALGQQRRLAESLQQRRAGWSASWCTG